VLPLTDFGTVGFAKSSARSAGGHAGTITDPAWSATRIALESSAGPGGGLRAFGSFAGYHLGAATAIPTVPSSAGAAFSVTFHQASAGPTQSLAA
jgi:hypothetical protein